MMMTDEMLSGLAERPWLRPFVEPDDEDLEAAEERWREAVEAAKAELRRLGVVVQERARTADGYETTMLKMPSEREER
jgi:hypothetical protein